MTSQLLRRLALLPLILFVASLIIFLLPYATGVDPTMAVIRARVGERVLTEESIERLRVELNMDVGLPAQYVQWIGRFVQGDLGFSYVSRTPVSQIIWRGLRVTTMLSIAALLLAIAIALPLGIWSAMRPGSWTDLFVTFTSQIGVAIPEYVMAPLLILTFALWLGWLPSAGWLLGGSVIVEVIFSIPGLGRIIYDAVLAGDIPLIQAGLMVIVTLAILINTLTDLLYIVLNPAIRLGEPSA